MRAFNWNFLRKALCWFYFPPEATRSLCACTDFESSSAVHLRHVYTLIKYLAKIKARTRSSSINYADASVCIHQEKEIFYSTSPTSFSFLSTPISFFRFSFTYTFLYQRKKSSLVCCFSFLLFFSSQLAALKHSQNLSTGVSHSTSDRGTVKTDNYFTFNFYFILKFPSSSLSFNSNSPSYRVIGGTENLKKPVKLTIPRTVSSGKYSEN